MNTDSDLRVADCQSFFMCLIPSFFHMLPSVLSPTLNSWMQDFRVQLYLSFSSCLVSPSSSACLTSSFSLFSPGEILFFSRGGCLALLLSGWFVEEKRTLPLLIIPMVLPSGGLPLLLLLTVVCLNLSTNPEDAFSAWLLLPVIPLTQTAVLCD